MVVSMQTILDFDRVFRALADTTRRDIVRRAIAGEEGVAELAGHYPMSFAAVQKHIAILERAGDLPSAHAEDGAEIERGRIYVAPPDHHLLIQPGFMRVNRGPKENGYRPAIDPMFRTAAATYGSRVVGVILSGVLDDGTAGLAAVKTHGGRALVQDPGDALYPMMPTSAPSAYRAGSTRR